MPIYPTTAFVFKNYDSYFEFTQYIRIIQQETSGVFCENSSYQYLNPNFQLQNNCLMPHNCIYHKGYKVCFSFSTNKG